MVMAAGQDERILNQLLEFNFGMRSTDEIDAEVDFSTRDRFQSFIGTDVQNANANAWIRFGKPADRARQEIEHRCRHRSHRDQARTSRANDMNGEHRGLELVDETTHLRQEVAAGHGEIDVAGRALEQGRTEAFLQLLNAAAERWLRQVQRLGGPHEASRLGDGDERLEVEQFCVHGPNSIISIFEIIPRIFAFYKIVRPEDALVRAKMSPTERLHERSDCHSM